MKSLSVPKIISECRELVKLCQINCSDPAFHRHSVSRATLSIDDQYEVLHGLFKEPMTVPLKFIRHLENREIAIYISRKIIRL